MSRIVIIIQIATLLCFSCISERDYECPDYEKYPLSIYSIEQEQNCISKYLTLYFVNLGNNTVNGFDCFEKREDDTLFCSINGFKFSTGSYLFKSIKSDRRIERKGKLFKINNGHPYFIGDTVGTVFKQKNNLIGVRFGLCNSLIQLKCHLDKEISNNYQLKKAFISAADDSFVFMDLHNGLCDYSFLAANKFNEMRSPEENELYEYYTVPIISGTILFYRVILVPTNRTKEIGREEDIILNTQLILEENIEQGKVYRFDFKVSISDLKYISTNVFEWENIEIEETISL